MQRSSKYSLFALLPVLLCLEIAVLLTGCGYHHPAEIRSDRAPLKLALVNWRNQTSELAIETELLQELNRWCSKASFISLTDAPEAGYILNGTIVALQSPGHTYSATDQAVELRALLTISYTLTGQQGKIIFKQPATVMTEDYPLGNDAIRTRDNRRKALGRIFRDLAEEIYMRILIAYEQEEKG